MSDGLPAVQEAMLDATTLAALVDDWLTHTRVLDWMTKVPPGSKASAVRSTDPAGLRDAVDQLVAGAVRAVQVRYLHEGVEWRDTLMADRSGPGRVARLVRAPIPRVPFGDLP